MALRLVAQAMIARIPWFLSSDIGLLLLLDLTAAYSVLTKVKSVEA